MAQMPAKHHYFLALLPDQKLQKEIRQIQLAVREKFNSSKALNAPPHITLQMPFRREEKEMEEGIGLLKKFAGNFIPYNVELEGFDHFDNRTIYIAVKKSDPLIVFQNELIQFLKTNLNFAEDELTLNFSPHVSVARRDLQKRRFNEAWEYFSKMQFRRSFAVHGFSLLIHDDNTWVERETFEFKVLK